MVEELDMQEEDIQILFNKAKKGLEGLENELAGISQSIMSIGKLLDEASNKIV